MHKHCLLSRLSWDSCFFFPWQTGSIQMYTTTDLQQAQLKCSVKKYITLFSQKIANAVYMLVAQMSNNKLVRQSSRHPRMHHFCPHSGCSEGGYSGQNSTTWRWQVTGGFTSLFFGHYKNLSATPCSPAISLRSPSKLRHFYTCCNVFWWKHVRADSINCVY